MSQRDRGRLSEELLVEREQPAELLERPLVVVDAEVDERRPRAPRTPAPARRRGSPPTADRGCRRRLPARRRGSREAARRVADPRSTRTCRRARRRLPTRRGCSPARRSQRRSGAQPSRCTRRPCTRPPVPARRRCRAGAVPGLVGLREARHGLVCGESLAKEREAVGPVPRVRPRLRGDRADVRLGPGDDAADREELRLHRDAPLLRVEVAGADGVRRDDRASRRSSPRGRARAATVGDERAGDRPERERRVHLPRPWSI